MAWSEMSRDALQAAQRLVEHGHHRSAVSRAYYAAYAGLSGELSRQIRQFAHGWNNPPHDQLIALVRGNLPGGTIRRRRVLHALRRLRLAREDADYRPAAHVDRPEALRAIQDAQRILRVLETGR